jgi:SAM-dependent methyltransferase
MSSSESTYFLGTSDHELDRLALQHEVWRGVTNGFLDALPVGPGSRVLDVGCGPGFLLADLRTRVGEHGTVVGLDESPRWVSHVERRIEHEGWSNVHAHRERVPLSGDVGGPFDLVLMRWVLSFLPDRRAVLASLARTLAPGGVLAVIDYNHEGLSLFPASPGFEAMVRALRARYEQTGGDVFVMGTVPTLLRSVGLEPLGLEPRVLAGGPGTDVFRWADAFFPHHTTALVAEGLATAEEHEAFLREWAEHRANPDALFYSPIVVCAWGRRSPA